MEQIIMVIDRFIETKFQFGNYVLWFLGVVSKHALKFQRWWFGPYMIEYYLFNNMVLLFTINKFDFNPVLVNINKLKPYRFIEDRTLQLVFDVLPSSLIDSNVNLRWKQQKNKESGHPPWLAALQG